MQNIITLIKNALALVRKDASAKILPLFKTMVTNIAAAGFSFPTAVTQGDLFLAEVAALAPGLTQELQTDIGNAIIEWAEATAAPTA